MKIRHKITLWISGVAFIAAVAFSSIIFWEILEEPVRLIDNELSHMATSLLAQANKNSQSPWTFDDSRLPYPAERYWIKIFDKGGRVLYSSSLTRYTDIPPVKDKSRYYTEKNIKREQINLQQDKYDEILFRVRVFTRQVGGQQVTIRIARPIEELEQELQELVREILAWLAISTLLIIAASYTMAGKILSPVVTMNRLAREITDTSLDKRLPVGRNHDELDTLAISLNTMFDRLRHSFDRQREFIGNASHELKSPLTLLVLSQEELLLNSKLPLDMRQDLERQLDTMRRMSKLISNLLDLSRLEQQETLTLEPLDPGAIIEQVLDDYQDMLAATDITVTTDLARDIFIPGDADKILRLCINLIDNAIRYNNAENGQLKILLTKEKQHIRLEVANTGKVIPPQDVEKVFEQFYRVEKSRSLAHGGSGLGLTISKRIVEMHRGTIKISSEKEGWTRITVILPLV